MIYKDGKQVKLEKSVSDVERAQLREVLEPTMKDRAPKGMFSLQTRANLKAK
jgi:hypothetical protein